MGKPDGPVEKGVVRKSRVSSLAPVITESSLVITGAIVVPLCHTGSTLAGNETQTNIYTR